MVEQTQSSMGEMPEPAAGSSGRNPRGTAGGGSNATAGKEAADPREQQLPCLSQLSFASRYVNCRIRNRKSGGVGGRRG